MLSQLLARKTSFSDADDIHDPGLHLALGLLGADGAGYLKSGRCAAPQLVRGPRDRYGSASMPCRRVASAS